MVWMEKGLFTARDFLLSSAFREQSDMSMFFEKQTFHFLGKFLPRPRPDILGISLWPYKMSQ